MSNTAAIETNDQSLFWEPVAERRWGKYISSVEDQHIRLAHELCGQPTNALEIGAEGGRWSKVLADLGWQMTCTDINAEALEVCQQRVPTAKCIHVDPGVEAIPADNASQKLVLCIEVHEVLETDWFIAELDRVLQSGGSLVGVFQNVNSIRGRLKSWFPNPNDSVLQYKESYRLWRNKLKARNFSFVREEGMCWMPFSRRSNSPLVPLATAVEKRIGLRNLPSLSPWIVMVAQKQ